MCALLQTEYHAEESGGELIINDFAFTVATKNGSGSQTSNNVLVKSLFRMGIPVNGKNLFPSNIKGLPTWYTIRVSKDGYTARRATTEIAIVMNQDTAAEDINNLPSGGVCILPQEWKWGHSRDDVIYYEIPVQDIVKQADIPSAFKDRVGNMVYVGAVARLFGISLEVAWQVLLDNFGGKEKPARMNMNVIEMAYEWVGDNIEKRDRYMFEPMDATEGKILITGNEAAAIGSLYGGLNVVAWYPITPSTSLVDAVMQYQNIRKDPETGKQTVAVVQAEDEIAAAGMIIGAGFAGARAMTATSGPGISLMSEFAGLAYFAEIPCVIWDITRMGPSTGLPTRTSQGDLTFAYFLGHGDSRHILLLPGTVGECFEYGWKSFDIAEQFQTPVLILSDLDLGMNNWMSEPFEYPDEPINRGKVLDADALEAFIQEHGKWGRYWDVDEDGIPYRTVPGTKHDRAAYFTRGTGHDEFALYSERADDWVKNMERLHKKYDTAREYLPSPIIQEGRDKKIGLITFGTNEAAVLEARDWLAEIDGVDASYMRIRSLPIDQVVHDFIHDHERIYVIENNFDGQLFQILCLENPADVQHMTKLALGDSLPMTPKWVYDNIKERI